jgi:hypothetical protein
MYYPWLGDPSPSTILGSAIYFADVTPMATYCPTYLVLDATRRLLRVGKPFPKSLGLQVIVHTQDHPPPHIHVQDLNRRGEDVRYLWPSLEPYSPDKRLSSQSEKNLKDYVSQYYLAISARVQATYAVAVAL